MAFIKLTEPNGKPVYVNALSIEAFCSDSQGARVFPINHTDGETYYTVKESPEEIMKIIEKDYIQF